MTMLVVVMVVEAVVVAASCFVVATGGLVAVVGFVVGGVATSKIPAAPQHRCYPP